MASLFGCTNTSPRSCDDCPIEERNKLIHVAFVKKGTTINKTTAALYMSTLLAAELSCNAYIIRNVSGEYDGGALAEGTGPGKLVSRVLGGTHIVTFTDFNYVGNEEFWNSFKSSSQNYEMHYFTDTRGWYVDKPISIAPKPAVTADNQTFMEAQIIAKWSSKDNPISYLANVDSLETCQVLFEFGTFVNESNSLATISGSTLTLDSGDVINTYTQTSITLDTVVVTEGTLPAGIAVSVSGTKIYITGSSVVPGTYLVTLRASNTCGVSGEFETTIVIV